MQPPDITQLIIQHRLAVENFREALRRNGDHADEDLAFREEELALLALCAFPPETMEQARRRAAYLVTTRLPDDLTVEGRAYLFSFVRGARDDR